MGQLKALLPFGERPMIAHIFQTLQVVSAIETIIVVTGHGCEAIESALDGLNVRFAHNADYQSGEMLSSVQTGVRALANSSHPFLLSLGDQPAIESETMAWLCLCWDQVNGKSESPIMVPTFNGRRGHPVLFSPGCKADILQLGAGETLKTIVRRHHENTLEVPVDDAAILEDIDTPEDYERALKKWQNMQSRGT